MWKKCSGIIPGIFRYAVEVLKTGGQVCWLRLFLCFGNKFAVFVAHKDAICVGLLQHIIGEKTCALRHVKIWSTKKQGRPATNNSISMLQISLLK